MRSTCFAPCYRSAQLQGPSPLYVCRTGGTRGSRGIAPSYFGRIRSKTCTITRPYITDCPPKLLDLALNSIQKAMDSKTEISQDQVEAKTPSPKTQVKPMSKAQGKQISEKIPIKTKSKIPLSQNQAKKLSDSDDSKSIEKYFYFVRARISRLRQQIELVLITILSVALVHVVARLVKKIIVSLLKLQMNS